MKWPIINISDLSNLLVRVITIGYEKKGESIVVLLINRANSQVIYSLVIDSYCRKNQNKTIEILRDNHVASLDMLCWSHPDHDHSRGIDKLFYDFCDSNTKVILPISFWSDDYNVKAFRPNRREIAFLNRLKLANASNGASMHPVGVSTGGCDMVDQRVISGGIDYIYFKVNAVSPFREKLKGIIDAFIANPKNMEPTRNQTSVSLLVEIGEYSLFFAADLPNNEIRLLDENRIFGNAPVFLKIPHHCSVSSDALLDYILPNSEMLACTTVYKSAKQGSDLPHKDVLPRYVNACREVYCTGSIPNVNSGVITADYYFFGTEAVCEISVEGSAGKVRLNP